MNNLLKIVWVLYLVGFTACTSRSDRRKAIVQEPDSIAYFVKHGNAIYPLRITVDEYQVMNRLKLDSVQIRNWHKENFFELEQEDFGNMELSGFLYVVVPFENIAGHIITPESK